MKPLLLLLIPPLALTGCANTRPVSYCDLPAPVFYSNAALDELQACGDCDTLAIEAVDSTKVMLEIQRRK